MDEEAWAEYGRAVYEWAKDDRKNWEARMGLPTPPRRYPKPPLMGVNTCIKVLQLATKHGVGSESEDQEPPR